MMIGTDCTGNFFLVINELERFQYYIKKSLTCKQVQTIVQERKLDNKSINRIKYIVFFEIKDISVLKLKFSQNQ